MVQGLRTVVYKVPDLPAAKEWYARILGIAPYFDEPFYVGFRVGGFELGLDPDVGTARPSCGVVAYWGVADVAEAHRRLAGLGVAALEDVQEVGGGVKVASFEDPFGNVFGIIENPHFSPADVR